jgi:hypothetical protein
MGDQSARVHQASASKKDVSSVKIIIINLEWNTQSQGLFLISFLSYWSLLLVRATLANPLVKPAKLSTFILYSSI